MPEAGAHKRAGSRGRENGRTGLVVVALGFWVIAIATILARRQPADQYEASLYAATPMPVWIGIVLALVVGIAIAIATERIRTRIAGTALAVTAILLVVCLPIVRGYRYLGEDDAMTHLGYARDIAGGIVTPTEVLYPAIHLHAIALSSTTGYGLESTLMLIAPTFVLVFVLSVALVMHVLFDDSLAMAIGAFSALCLLPLNGIAVHLQAHPSSMAILYVPVLYLLILLALDRPRPATLALLAIAAPTFVLLHPLHAANAVSMLLAVGVAITLARIGSPVGPREVTGLDRRAVGIVALGGVGIALFAWIIFASVDRVARFGSTIRYSLLAGDPAGTITHYLEALGSVGGDVGELFVKLFLVSAIFSGIALGLMAVVLLRWYRTGGLPPLEKSSSIGYLAIGLLPVGATTLLFLGTGVGTFAFRQIGFVMALVTVLGAVGVVTIHGAVRQQVRNGTLTMVTIGFVVVIVLGSLLVIYPSPYIYQPMGHVTDDQVTGFETSFDIRDDEVAYSHLRSLPHRYSDAIHGERAHHRLEFYNGELQAHAPDRFADHDLPGEYDEPRYLVVTGADREREPHVFRGLRFDEDDFAYLERDRRINRVHSNDEFDLYLIYPAEPDEEG